SSGGPQFLNYVNTELVNAGVAVTLISTPQFAPRLAEFEKRTNWNGNQFRRRFGGRWRALDINTKQDHLCALAKQHLPDVGTKGIKLAVGYAGAFGRDVSALFDLVLDAKRRARQAGRSAVSYQDLRDAYEIDRVPSENAMAAAFVRPLHEKPG